MTRRSIVRARLPAAALLLLFAPAAASQQAQPPICVAFNDAIGVYSTYFFINPFCNTAVSTTFVAPSSFVATEIEILACGFAGGLCGTFASTSGGSATGCPAPLPNPFSVALWYTLPFAAIGVNAGDTCTVTITSLASYPPVSDQIRLYIAAPFTQATSFSLTTSCVGNPCPSGGPCQQPPFNANIVFRIRGPACTGAAASTVPVGTGCGLAPLLSSNLATPGTNFQFATSGPMATPGTTASLFFAAGPAVQAWAVEPLSPCHSYLDPASLAALSTLGHEPFQTVPVYSNGQTNFAFLVPLSPAVIGQIVTFQAVFIDPAGVPLNSVPGMSVRLTNAVQITVGA